MKVHNLCAWYGAAQILFDVSLELGRGEVVALMGRNGAGKSTTMKAIMGLVPRRSGSVRFMEQELTALRSYEIARLGVGWVPEDRRIFTDLSVTENLEVGRRAPRAGVHWTLEKLFTLFPNLAELRDRPGGRISGGEQQMLTVARTLMGNPLVVLLDEPSEGVAPVIVERMAATIQELKREGLSILLSEQNLHFAGLVSDRVYVLEKGHVAWSGTMAELSSNVDVQRQHLTV
jgi:branched-chain amino acid transport system ATP-binding protein